MLAAAVNEMVNIVRDQKQERAKKHVTGEVCELANAMEKMKRFLTEARQNPQHHTASPVRFGMFMNKSSILAVKLMFFYPDFYDTCYEKMLVHLFEAIKPNSQQGNSNNSNWMYDKDFHQRLRDYRMNKTEFPFKKEIYDKLLQNCDKSNSCIRKMKSMCIHARSPVRHAETVETLRDDVCKIKLMKETVAKHTKHLWGNQMMQSSSKPKDAFGKYLLLI